MPIAMNCTMPATATDGFAGITVMETNMGGAAVTVRVVEPTMFPSEAEMPEVPVATPVASPVVLIVATLGVRELHVAFVKTAVLPSEYVPVAVN